MKKVRKIDIPKKENKRELRVVAYCRVSTTYESQKSSIEAQKITTENIFIISRIGYLQVFMWITAVGEMLHTDRNFKK